MSGSPSKAGGSSSISKANQAESTAEERGDETTQHTPGSEKKENGKALGLELSAEPQKETDYIKGLSHEARSLRAATTAAEAERDSAAEQSRRMRELLIQQGLGYLLDEHGKPK